MLKFLINLLVLLLCLIFGLLLFVVSGPKGFKYGAMRVWDMTGDEDDCPTWNIH